MHKAIIQLSEQAYDFLLKFYPSSYRKEFGSEMKYVFSESLKDTQTEHGDVGILTFWARTISDAGKSLIVQHFEEQKGGGIMKQKQVSRIHYKEILLGTGVILLVPFIMTQLSSDWDWGVFDFAIIGALLIGGGLAYEILSSQVAKRYKAAVGIAVLAFVLLVWIHLAVGIVDTWPLAGS